MYWTDVNSQSIERSGMDGTDRTILVKNLGWPNALALDQPAGRLYTLDASKDIAFSMNLDGSDIKVRFYSK